MYHYYITRQRDTLAFCMQLLNETSRNMMAAETRLYSQSSGCYFDDRLGHSSTSSISGSSAMSGSTAATSLSMMSATKPMTSTASSPSLRSRESVIVSSHNALIPPGLSPGGNVKVVVRVRGFLPRGEIWCAPDDSSRVPVLTSNGFRQIQR